MEFCKAFNANTKDLEPGLPIPVVITVYVDHSFTFITKTPPTAVLLLKAAGIEKGSSTPNTQKVAKLPYEAIKTIAQAKIPDLNTEDITAAARIVAGTARSIGIDIEGEVL